MNDCTFSVVAVRNRTSRITLARVDRLRIVTEIPEAEARLVKIGQPATFQVNAARGQPLADLPP
jgi:hypothetical protein